MSRRAFLKASLSGAAASVFAAQRACAQSAGPFDLEHDVLPLGLLPRTVRQRAFVAERTGPLSEGYYAVHVSLVEAIPGRPMPRAAEARRAADAPTDDEERFAALAEEVNGWFAQQLTGRRLRFLYQGVLPDSRTPQPDAGSGPTTAALLQRAGRAPAFGGSQQLQLLLVRDAALSGAVIANTILLRWPADLADLDIASLAPPLAHLIGHALSLEHPRPDVDTAGTAWASEFSFMHPGMAERPLNASLILDSPLNPEKARLVRSGFFPYRGVIHTAAEGAVPLQPAMTLEGSNQEVRIAHGNYILPAQPGTAALTVRGAHLTVDLGGALIWGDDADFAEFGQHETHGIGVHLVSPHDVPQSGPSHSDPLQGDPPAGAEGITLRGGIISGYHYGVKGDGLLSSRLEGVTLVDNRRLPSDARRDSGDTARGVWLDFWLTPQEDATEFWVGSLEEDGLMAGMGAGIALLNCRGTVVASAIATHNTIGIADYFGHSNQFEDSDLGGCPMGLRFWQARGTDMEPIRVLRNRFRFNTQPEPWWWSQGDSAAIIAAGVGECIIEENEIVFGGDGLFLSGFPRFPARSQGLLIRANQIAHCYAHGVELDFVQNCMLEHNHIAHNWLSGVWAGHTAGLLARNNSFTANNRGRMYGGWTDTQGALSCAQGRVVLHGNQFEDNWVAVNLWQAHYQPWWLFAGDATGHAVTGNTFHNNRVGVRLKDVAASEITGNLMDGNGVDLLGDLSGNQVADNGPATDPSHREAWFFPVQALLFDSQWQETGFRILWLNGDEAFVVAPDELMVVPATAPGWLEVTAGPDGGLRCLASMTGQGLRSARLEIAARGKRWSVPAKAMCGDFQVMVGPGDPASGLPEDLGTTPVGPAAIFGLFPTISDILRSARPTGITASEPFWARFLQPEFRLSEDITKLFAVMFTDAVSALTLGENGPVFAPEPPGEDQYWLWNAGLLELQGAPDSCRLDYGHGPDLVKKGMPSCLAMWLYPLDTDDLAHLPPVPEVAAPTAPDYLLSLPGARRRWPRPQ